MIGPSFLNESPKHWAVVHEEQAVASVATIAEGFALEERNSPDGSAVISVEITTEADYDVASLVYA